MTKPRLSDAVTNPQGTARTDDQKPSGPDGSEPTGGNTPEGDGVSGSETSAESESDDDDPEAGESSGADPAAGSLSPPDPGSSSDNSAGKDLAAYREAFGHEQGSVFFADQTPFVEACTAHMKVQADTIASQAKQIEELQATAARLGQELHGEGEPVGTHVPGSTSGGEDVDAVGAYAAGLKLPGDRD